MLVLSNHPHIHHQSRAGRLSLSAALALGPLALAAAALRPAPFLFALGATAVAAVGTALALGRGKIGRPALGWCLFEAALLVLLMPAAVSWFVPALMTAAVVFARTLITDRDFLPPVNAVALAAGAAVLFTAPGTFELSFGSPAAVPGVTGGNFFFLSGWLPLASSLLLTAASQRRYFKWRIVLTFLITIGLAVVAWMLWAKADSQSGWYVMTAYVACFASFTLIADNRSTPLAARGQYLAGGIAGIVFALFAVRGMFYQGMIFSALAANLVTPPLDYALARDQSRR